MKPRYYLDKTSRTWKGKPVEADDPNQHHKAFWRYPFTAKDAPPWFEDVRGYVAPWDDLAARSRDLDKTTKRVERFLGRLWFFTAAWALLMVITML